MCFMCNLLQISVVLALLYAVIGRCHMFWVTMYHPGMFWVTAYHPSYHPWRPVSLSFYASVCMSVSEATQAKLRKIVCIPQCKSSLTVSHILYRMSVSFHPTTHPSLFVNPNTAIPFASHIRHIFSPAWPPDFSLFCSPSLYPCSNI